MPSAWRTTIVDAHDFMAYFLEKDLQVEEFSRVSCFIQNDASRENGTDNCRMLGMLDMQRGPALARGLIGEVVFFVWQKKHASLARHGRCATLDSSDREPFS